MDEKESGGAVAYLGEKRLMTVQFPSGWVVVCFRGKRNQLLGKDYQWLVLLWYCTESLGPVGTSLVPCYDP